MEDVDAEVEAERRWMVLYDFFLQDVSGVGIVSIGVDSRKLSTI